MVDVGKIIDYENGNLSEEETTAMFQAMIDDGTVWQLQGSYGRTAAALIAAGECRDAAAFDRATMAARRAMDIKTTIREAGL